MLPPSNCTSCSSCVLTCPKHLIHLLPDKAGFLYPQITDTKACTHCHLCENACPILHKPDQQTHNLETFAGYLKEKPDLISCASGGIATATARTVLHKNGIVFGVKYTTDFAKAVFSKAETESELEQFKGSKYILAEKGNVYQSVKEELTAGKLTLFIGLPCEIAGLKTYLRKEYANLLTCELICHGATSPKVAEEYIKDLCKKYNSEITAFSVRYKKEGNWTPPYLRAKFASGKEYQKPLYETEYGRAFSLFSRPSCYACNFKGDARVADITIGDYWGATTADAFWNPHGVSAIFVHTEHGKNIINELEGVALFDTSFEHAAESNPLMIRSRMKSPKYDTFEKDFVAHGLHEACRNSYSLQEKLRAKIPRGVKKIASNFCHKIRN